MDDQLSRAFAALADPTRRDIVARLSVGDATVNELAEPFDVTVQNISKHIREAEARYTRLDAVLDQLQQSEETNTKSEIRKSS